LGHVDSQSLSAALFDLPHEQEGVPDVFVWAALVVHGVRVHYVPDQVHEAQHVLLQHLGGVGELANVTKRKDGVDVAARGKGLNR
jgi:hypothetical protein